MELRGGKSGSDQAYIHSLLSKSNMGREVVILLQDVRRINTKSSISNPAPRLNLPSSLAKWNQKESCLGMLNGWLLLSAKTQAKIKNCDGKDNTRNIHKSQLSIYEFVCFSSVSPDAGFQSHQSCLEWLIRCDKACGRISLQLEKTRWIVGDPSGGWRYSGSALGGYTAEGHHLGTRSQPWMEQEKASG